MTAENVITLSNCRPTIQQIILTLYFQRGKGFSGQPVIAQNLTVHKFFLLTFQNLHHAKLFFFLFLLLVYLAILVGNLLIIITVHKDVNLQSPMYFFLGHLSISEVVFTTNIIPNMLHMLLHNGIYISLEDCVTQMFMFFMSTAAECLLLTVMSYDRFIAICRPLHYSVLMKKQTCLLLVGCSWLTAIAGSLLTPVLVSMLRFCGPNAIDHFFCDLAPVLQLSCSDTSFVETEDAVISFPFLVFPFIYIIVTYIQIIVTILKIPSSTGKQKAFSTCSSHLLVVCSYFGTLIIVYVIPSVDHYIDKILALLYTVGTPLLNPIIYSLRNKELLDAIKKLKWPCKRTNI
ncbi:olfactory receptor 10A7-like [Gastrophryne carolinensis]